MQQLIRVKQSSSEHYGNVLSPRVHFLLTLFLLRILHVVTRLSSRSCLFVSKGYWFLFACCRSLPLVLQCCDLVVWVQTNPKPTVFPKKRWINMEAQRCVWSLTRILSEELVTALTGRFSVFCVKRKIIPFFLQNFFSWKGYKSEVGPSYVIFITPTLTNFPGVSWVCKLFLGGPGGSTQTSVGVSVEHQFVWNTLVGALRARTSVPVRIVVVHCMSLRFLQLNFRCVRYWDAVEQVLKIRVRERSLEKREIFVKSQWITTR